MCTKTLSCILCGQPNFHSIDALRVSLLKVTARPLKCPICGDELLGLDKLTIHLFGHSILEDQQSVQNESGTGQVVHDDATNQTGTTFASSSFKTLRKVRKKVTQETEVKHHGQGKMSPVLENSQCGSSSSFNANHCSECDVAFRNAALLKMHREVFHDSSNIATTVTPARDGAFDKRFHCHICPKEFKMKGSLKIHMRVVHDAGSKKICLDGDSATSSRAIETGSLVATDTGSGMAASGDSTKDSKSHATILPLQMLFQPQVSPADEASSGQPVPSDPHIIQIIDPRQLAQVVYLPPSNGSQQTSLPTQPNAQNAGVSQQARESFSLPSSPQQQGQQHQQGHESAKQWECEPKESMFLDGSVCNEDEDKQTADYVNRTLDELVKGTYDKLDLGNASSPSLLYDHQLQPPQSFYDDIGIANQQPQSSTNSDTNFPRIESLCLLSPSAFDGSQLEDLEGLKLDNGW
uniref:C2H2-type domain-containing protein n=1 Tax=Anopheles epiroticus TaxID=199890 RepID=A0A182PRP2_9DIPT